VSPRLFSMELASYFIENKKSGSNKTKSTVRENMQATQGHFHVSARENCECIF